MVKDTSYVLCLMSYVYLEIGQDCMSRASGAKIWEYQGLSNHSINVGPRKNKNGAKWQERTLKDALAGAEAYNRTREKVSC